MKANFDATIGYGCNFRCSYCFEGGCDIDYANVAMSKEVAIRYGDYLKYMKRNILKGKQFSVQVYGGEPLLYLDTFKHILSRADGWVNTFNFITNGSLVLSKADELIEMWDKAISRTTMSVSYDFVNQDTKRQKGSYETVRDAIRFLYKHKRLRKIITVVDSAGLSTIDEVFFDFIKLREECPGIVCTYNLSLFDDCSGFDEEKAKAALGRIRDYLAAHPEHHGSFIHNSIDGPTARWNAPGCAYCSTVSAVDVDGTMRSSYCMSFHTEAVKKVTEYGSVFDDFNELYQNQLSVLSNLDLSTPEPCKDCKASCKIHRFRSMVSGDGKWNGMPTAASCHIRKVVSSFLDPFRYPSTKTPTVVSKWYYGK